MKRKETYMRFVLGMQKDERYKSLGVDHFDYFSGDDETEFSVNDVVTSTVTFGSCEGIYIDFWVRRINDRGKREFVHAATAKDLTEGRDSFIENHRRAALVTLLMNEIIEERYFDEHQ